MPEPTPPPQAPNLATPGGHSLIAKGDVLFGLGRLVRNAEGRTRVRIVWLRLALALLLVALAGWFALAGAVWGFVRFHRGVTTARFIDIVAPFRWEEYRRKRGDDYIKLGRQSLAAGQMREAYQLLRIGVAKSPANLDGRQRLAQVYNSFGRADLGLTVMEEGLPFAGDDAGYLRNFIALLLASQQDERVKDMAIAGLAAAPAKSEKARLFAQAAAIACFNRGNYDQAEDFLTRFDLLRTKDARVLLARADWERGFRDLAIFRLRSFITENPSDEEVYSVLFAYLREGKRLDEAGRLAVLRSVAFPDSLPAHISLLYAYADKADRTRVERETDGILRDFPNDPRVLPQLADFAIATADVALAERIRTVAAERGAAPEIGAISILHARVAARDYAGAIAQAESIASEKGEWRARHAASIAGAQAVAYYGIGRAGFAEVYLKQFLEDRNTRPAEMLVTASRLQAAGARDAARRVLAHAADADKLNQAALTSLISLDLDDDRLDDLPANLERLVGMRKPSVELLSRACERLGSDTLPFSPERERVLPKIRAALEARAGTATAPSASVVPATTSEGK